MPSGPALIRIYSVRAARLKRRQNTLKILIPERRELRRIEHQIWRCVGIDRGRVGRCRRTGNKVIKITPPRDDVRNQMSVIILNNYCLIVADDMTRRHGRIA